MQLVISGDFYLATHGDFLGSGHGHLGYRKPDSFRRARTRHPIPGEIKTDDGRPCWTPGALRSWQSKRKIAGNRTHAGGPD